MFITKLAFRQKNQDCSGFTLIETLIAFSIFALLGAVMLFSQQQARLATNVRITADAIVSALFQMQNHALAGEVYAGTSPARDYGMKISSSSAFYETFVEEAVTLAYKSLTIYNFPQGVMIRNLRVTSNGVVQAATSVEIRFLLPFGAILVTAKNGSSTLFTESPNVIVQFDVAPSAAGSKSWRVIIDGLSGRIDNF